MALLKLEISAFPVLFSMKAVTPVKKWSVNSHNLKTSKKHWVLQPETTVLLKLCSEADTMINQSIFGD